MSELIDQQTVYIYCNKLYLNITNKCNCDCVFCVDKFQDSMGGFVLKYQKDEPDFKYIVDLLDKLNWNNYKELVFCGFGEPTCRLDLLFSLLKYCREHYPSKFLKLNTNGLGNLYNNIDVLDLISPYLDAISVSMNAQTPDAYQFYTRAKYDKNIAYDTVIKTIEKAVSLGIDTTATVVYNEKFAKIDLVKCEQLANKLGAKFKVRIFKD